MIRLGHPQAARLLIGGRVVVKVKGEAVAIEVRERRRTWRARDVAAFCGVNPRTVHRWVSAGAIPCVRNAYGREAEFVPGDVMRWWEARER